MKVKIVGIQEMKFTLDNGYSFEGKKFHAIDTETEKDGLLGKLTTTFKLSKEHPFYNAPVVVGKNYTVYFDQKGGLDFIQECSPAPVK